MNNTIKDKIRGNFLGIAIGDSLGKAAECMTPKEIVEKFGRITDYQDCKNHKYFENDEKGTVTDDYQLTAATARGLISSNSFNMDAIAAEHVKEFNISVRGWGKSTRESVQNIANGIHWKESGKTDKAGRGTGNGVCMKVSPIGLFMALENVDKNLIPWNKHINNIVDFSLMTHRTSIAITSGIAHAFATFRCFTSKPEQFNKKSFQKMLLSAGLLGRQFLPETLKDDIFNRFEELENDLTIEEIAKFTGSCYVYDSLPFTYAFFMRNPYSIESLFDCLNQGGDTDSNCSMLGGLLGSLHGTSIFPKYLIDGLKNKDEVFDLADQFYEKFK